MQTPDMLVRYYDPRFNTYKTANLTNQFYKVEMESNEHGVDYRYEQGFEEDTEPRLSELVCTGDYVNV